jgi:hypothetical protein
MRPSEAQKVIEALRKGMPPDGYVRHFTVGRKSEIDTLNARLKQPQRGALLLKANYGSGKSHLLRFLRETALEEGYVVSAVSLDARSAIRFNRMDQILGAIWRGIEVPNSLNHKGVRPFFDTVCAAIETSKSQKQDCLWRDLTNNWKWDFSNVLDAPASFVALRAWSTGVATVHDLIEDWLFQPWNYRSQRRHLYTNLIERLRPHFRDPRPEWKFYHDGIFEFHSQGYSQSWGALRDVCKLSMAAGYKGFIILFDEFEDVIHNIKNINHQEAAFWNLFEFYMGDEFQGMTYFAVTPDFTHKCKNLLMQKLRWDYDYSMFDKISTFEMSPLSTQELQELSMKILEVHGLAYDWEPDLIMKMSELKAITAEAASVQVQDRARHTIREIVKYLDNRIEDTSWIEQ